jgi:hypothetical protein
MMESMVRQLDHVLLDKLTSRSHDMWFWWVMFFCKLTPFKSQHMKVTIQNKIISFSTLNSKLGRGTSVPNLMLGQKRSRT